MNLADFLAELGEAGVEVALHPTDPVRLRYTPARLPDTLLQGLRQHRAAILDLLRGGYAAKDEDAAYMLGERLGIADDLGLPAHPGSAAWLIAVAESMRSPR